MAKASGSTIGLTITGDEVSKSGKATSFQMMEDETNQIPSYQGGQHGDYFRIGLNPMQHHARRCEAFDAGFEN
jgi:hypothetical protein